MCEREDEWEDKCCNRVDENKHDCSGQYSTKDRLCNHNGTQVLSIAFNYMSNQFNLVGTYDYL